MKKRVVIVGAGFGGVAAAQAIAPLENAEIFLIDRRNFHLFQPLLYQVAMAGLNPSDIAVPLRHLFRKQKNVQIILAEVDTIDCSERHVHFDQTWLSYDYLIVACGAKHAYFGKPEWEEIAPGLKTIEQATEIRRRILTAFEIAEKSDDPELRKKALTFAIVGGGPTGVELAGAIAEMVTHTLSKEYRRAHLENTKVILIEAGPRILPAFSEKLSQVAQENLESLGITVITNCRASNLSKEGLQIGDTFVAAKTILWAAGVSPSSITQQIPGEKDKLGRVLVKKDLSIPQFPNVFVIGDQSTSLNSKGNPLPGIAPVAIQQGIFLGKLLKYDFSGKPRPEFQYFDKGIMATIGRSKAVVSTMGLQFSGFLAWITWVFVHVVYLIRYKNRFFVLLQWAWAYFTFGRGARLITHKTWRFYSGEKIKLE